MAGMEDGCAGSGGLLGGDAGERDEVERQRETETETVRRERAWKVAGEMESGEQI